MSRTILGWAWFLLALVAVYWWAHASRYTLHLADDGLVITDSWTQRFCTVSKNATGCFPLAR